MVTSDENGEEGGIPQNRICSACVGEAFLKAEIERTGENATCSYCDEDGKTVTIGELADEVETALEDHFRVTSEQPDHFQEMMLNDSESTYQWEREGDAVGYVIADVAHIDEAPAEDVRQVLYDRTEDFDAAAAGDENPFDEEAHYADKDPKDHELQASWSYLEHSLKTETRLFNKEAEGTLNSVFEELAQHKTRDDKSVLVEVGPGLPMQSVFRARVFQSRDKLQEALERPDIGLGPPPAALAVAGRMNARGISVFYGSTEQGIAISEVRPPVGSRVVLARFEFIRRLRLLDVVALRSIFVRGSVFDRSYIRRLEKAKFLERLSNRIIIPVMPEDEPADYLITQAIADYLSGFSTPSIDGLIFRSVQSAVPGSNVMLFHKSSRVKLMDIPAGTEITTRLEGWDDDDPVPDYFVWENAPAQEEARQEADHVSLFFDSSRDTDSREPTLQMDPTSIKVHHIRGASFATDEFDVHRRRISSESRASAPPAGKSSDFDDLL
jgi:hypothetical protein